MGGEWAGDPGRQHTRVHVEDVGEEGQGKSLPLWGRGEGDGKETVG